MDIRSPSSSKRRGIGSPTPDRKSFSLLVEEQKETKASQFQQLVLSLSENVTRDSLVNLRNWLIHNSGIERVDAQTASALVDVLMRAIGKRESKVKGQLNQDSQLALVVLFEYAQKVEEIRTAIESKNVGELRQMKLQKHVLDMGEEHSLVALKFVYFIQQSFSKYSKLKNFIPNDVNDVEKKLKDMKSIIENSVILPNMSEEDQKLIQAAPTYYDVDVDTTVNIFKTSIEKGLAESEIPARREKYGSNLLPRAKPKSIWRILFNQVKDLMIIILAVAAAASAGIGDYKATVALAAVIIINVIIGFTQEYRAEKALNSLLKLDVPQAKVLRDGEVSIIVAAELVPGDIVLLEEGAQVPADLRLCEAVNLQVVESILTGESTAVEKTTKQITTKRLPIGDRFNMGYMSTMVVKGRGKGIVVATAEHTEMGKISLRLSKAKTPRTPLQKRLTRLGLWLVIVSVVLCVLIVVIGFARGNYWLDMLRVGISLAVSVIPEGLVAVTTVTMAIGVSRMAKHNVVVRKLHAVETLGSITTICSDKTGTLTEGKMRATKIWVGGHEYRIKGRSMDHNDTSSKITRTLKNGDKAEITRVNVPEYLQLLLMGAALCNNTGWMEDDNGVVAMTGDPTEIALHLAAMKVGLGKDKFTQEQGFTFVNEFAFDSERKRMSVVYKNNDKYYCFVKGAPEFLLKKCTHYHSKGQEKPLADKIEKVEKQAAKMAAHGLRILAFGYKSYDLNDKHDGDFQDINQVEDQLNFVGLIGLMDSPRKEVAKVIARCQGAGIRVCMITGDHPSTAKAIAIKLGLASEHSTVLTGDQIDMLTSTGELKTLDPFPTVFARVSPDNKLQIVEALQSRNEVVSMTGDGVNDAPAIKRADCGVAMGITGTDITKQSASIVLADDNFKTIAYAVQEGRRIYDNIKKFILYLLSCNAAEIFVMLLAVIIAAPVPFAPIQILWANIIADIPPAMSLGIDPSEKDVMARKPRNPKQGIFTVRSALVLVAQGLSMAGLALGVLLVTTTYFGYDVRHARSTTFTVLTMTQLWHSFLSRSQTQSIFVTGLFGNKWLIGAFFLSTTLLLLSIYVPGFNDLIELYPLNGYDWIAVIASMIVHTAVMELIKACLRLRARLLGKKKKPSIFYEDV